jgi:large subunit ribosomal protein L20
MPRVRKGAARRLKHKRVLARVKGYYGTTSRRYHLAIQKSYKNGVYATRDRRDKKRTFRALFITRITAACRARGLRYSQLIRAMELTDIKLNRKMLSEIAIADPAGFDAVLKAALGEEVVAAAAAK